MRKSLWFPMARLVVVISALAGGINTQAAVLAQEDQPQAGAAADSQELLQAKAPGDFVVGAEDVLGILVWREPEISGDVTVRSDGMITLPLIGDLYAAGHTPEELADKVEALAGAYLNDPNVTVVVRQINSRKVFITGEVAAPGAYPLGGPLTVVQLISLAGGVNEFADEQKINIMRVGDDGHSRVVRFNYKWIREGKRLDQNILLKPGDTVVVP